MANAGQCGIWPFSSTDCAGVGTCAFSLAFGRNTCTCPAGYTGLSDFYVTSDVTDCQLSLVAVQVLWAINLFFCVLSIPLCGVRARKLLRLQRDRARARGVPFRAWENVSLMAITPYTFAGLPAQMGLGILRIATPNTHIGVDWSATILWWILRLSWHCVLFSFQPTLLATLLRSQKNLDAEPIIRLNFAGAFVMFWVGLSVQFAAAAPIVLPVDPFNPVPAQIAAVLFYFGSFVVLFGSGMQAIYINNQAQKLLDKATDARSLWVRSNLLLLQRNFSFAFTAQGLVSLAFGVLPWLWHLHDYQFPVTCIAFPLLYIRTCGTLLRIMQSPVMGNADATPTTSAGTSKRAGDDAASPGASGGRAGAPVGTTDADAQQRRVGGFGGQRNETAFDTSDVTSVLVVDENSDSLLATGGAWKGTKQQNSDRAVAERYRQSARAGRIEEGAESGGI